MPRLLAILLSFALAITCAAVPTLALLGEEAVRKGSALHGLRTIVTLRLKRARGRLPLVVFLGDSTVMEHEDFSSYPVRIKKLMSDRVQLKPIVHAGLQFYHYYCLMGPVLDRGPRLVVLLANPRMIYGRTADDPILDQLAPLIPTAELHRALALPFYERGLAAPDLLLLRITRWNGALRVLDVGRGLRKLLHERALARLGDIGELPPGPKATFAAVFRASWDRKIERSTPMVRMMRATLQMAERRGHPVLVIGAPVPMDMLLETDWFEASVQRERMQVLRSVAEESGAYYLDLHEALGSDGFRDGSGHYSAAGTARMVELIEPEIARLLLQ